MGFLFAFASFGTGVLVALAVLGELEGLVGHNGATVVVVRAVTVVVTRLVDGLIGLTGRNAYDTYTGSTRTEVVI